jgi:hypothetical protein
MFKDRDRKLAAGPIWDCDRCMGSYDGRDLNPAGWSATLDGTDLFAYGWWADLLADPEIEARYWARFEELLDGPFAEARINTIIDPMADDLDEAAARNFARFPAAAPLTGAYRDEIDHLKAWLAERTRWIAGHLGRR